MRQYRDRVVRAKGGTMSERAKGDLALAVSHMREGLQSAWGTAESVYDAMDLFMKKVTNKVIPDALGYGIIEVLKGISPHVGGEDRRKTLSNLESVLG